MSAAHSVLCFRKRPKCVRDQPEHRQHQHAEGGRQAGDDHADRDGTLKSSKPSTSPHPDLVVKQQTTLWVQYSNGYVPLFQAAQKLNNFQFATTTVTISVQQKSLHPPQFETTQYEGLITSVGQMAVNSKNEPLQITAKDEDYVETGVRLQSIALLMTD